MLMVNSNSLAATLMVLFIWWERLSMREAGFLSMVENARGVLMVTVWPSWVMVHFCCECSSLVVGELSSPEISSVEVLPAVQPGPFAKRKVQIRVSPCTSCLTAAVPGTCRLKTTGGSYLVGKCLVLLLGGCGLKV